MNDDKTYVYAKRFNQVFDFIERHLDDTLLLERLSEEANFSPFHFHRQFSSYCGMPVGRYIQLMRLKRASYRLAFNPLKKSSTLRWTPVFNIPNRSVVPSNKCLR